jgi:hypothetical protein
MSTASAVQHHASAQVTRFLVCEGAYFPIEGDAPAGVYWIDWHVVDASDGRHAVHIVELQATYGGRRINNILSEFEARLSFSRVAAAPAVAIGTIRYQRDQDMMTKARHLLEENGELHWRDLIHPYTHDRDEATFDRLIADGSLVQDDDDGNPKVTIPETCDSCGLPCGSEKAEQNGLSYCSDDCRPVTRADFAKAPWARCMTCKGNARTIGGECRECMSDRIGEEV